jgi:hypothetical protein
VTGSGFDSNPVYNFITFGAKRGTIVSASETQLTVVLPNVSGGAVKVKTSKKGAVNWSDEIDFTFA